MAYPDSREAFIEHLEVRYHRQLFNRCMRIAGYDKRCADMAEECVQDVLIAAYQNHDTLKEHPNLIGWLYTACNYRMQTQLRQARSVWRQETPLEDVGDWRLKDGAPDALDRWHEQEDASSAARHVLQTLSETDRALLHAHHLEEKSLKDIARERGTSESSVKVTLHRARKKAAEILKNYLNLLLTSWR